MLPILVLALAASAFAAPGAINIRQVSSNDVGFSDRSVLGSFSSIYDDGEASVNSLNLVAVIKDLANVDQATALGQAIALYGDAATGNFGDACAAANYINAYTRYVSSGNAAGVREALAGFFQALSVKIDNLVALATNKDSVKYKTGVRGGCPNAGRTYQFEQAWDIILGSAAPQEQSLVQEEYCVAKRLYCGFLAAINNAGAAATATALPPSKQIFKTVKPSLVNFVSALGAKSNPGAAAEALKRDINFAISRISF